MVDPLAVRASQRCSKVKSKKDIANFSAKDADRPPQALGFLPSGYVKIAMENDHS